MTNLNSVIWPDEKGRSKILLRGAINHIIDVMEQLVHNEETREEKGAEGIMVGGRVKAINLLSNAVMALHFVKPHPCKVITQLLAVLETYLEGTVRFEDTAGKLESVIDELLKLEEKS